MARTRSNDRQKETHWREQLALQAGSGLSIAAWCRQNQVALSIFHYWRRALARRDKAAMAHTMPEAANVIATPMFVPVVVGPQAQTPLPTTTEAVLAETGWIEIHFPHRASRVRVAPGFDASTLARLLDVLERRAC